MPVKIIRGLVELQSSSESLFPSCIPTDASSAFIPGSAHPHHHGDHADQHKCGQNTGTCPITLGDRAYWLKHIRITSSVRVTLATTTGGVGDRGFYRLVVDQHAEQCSQSIHLLPCASVPIICTRSPSETTCPVRITALDGCLC